MILEKWEKKLLGVLVLANLEMGSLLLEMTILTLIGNGAQPHLVNIQFQKKVKLQLVVLYVDFKLDESYTPSKISIRAGDGFHNLKEIKTMELVKPTGWVYLSLSGNDPRETFVNTFMLQIAVLSNHLNGRDTHVRQIKVYGPQLNPFPHQPFQFTSREFITYSSVR
ncbi:anaphase-promoting complex subunit 10 isoform X2 [Populus trichocarpa]|uniref:anaphase-promoting complex subunit 10 isoform X2 n=1 Tax=Populus trichocarpa TaxID=3694 RepID=UPI000D187E01|nr:anaphase-promoting complex subunit 10 isoform X2 [Populus trichocarpa]|eukprot:XP_024461229.1 anaphase-promoting complex subunit 10 isoform X2 [Populus trichocarpa]